jgi:3-hydroxybutyryl-CoA dehydrogenase
MATGIVEVFAKAGYDVIYVARGQDKVDGVLASIEEVPGQDDRARRLTQEAADAINGRLTGTTDIADLADVDIVVEAIAEDLAIKQELFRDLDRICKPGAILATTTSSLPIIQCAKVTSRPGDVIGMHFFNPAQVMKLVEVVSTVATDPDVTRPSWPLPAVGKVPCSAATAPASSSTRCCSPTSTTRSRCSRPLRDRRRDRHGDEDRLWLPMGPFELLDVVGLDVSLAIQRELYMEFREPGFAPAPLLEHLVTAGYLGRKTKRGFRTY